MGTMLVSFHAGGASYGDEVLPVARLTGAKTERKTTNPSTSVVTTLTATYGGGKKADGGIATVTAVGVNLMVVAGTAPVAAYPAADANANGIPVMSGQSVSFGVAKGEKIAAIEFT